VRSHRALREITTPPRSSCEGCSGLPWPACPEGSLQYLSTLALQTRIEVWAPTSPCGLVGGLPGQQGGKRLTCIGRSRWCYALNTGRRRAASHSLRAGAQAGDRFGWHSETPLLGGKRAEPEIRVIEPEGSNAARPQDPEARRQQLDKGPDQEQLLRPPRRARLLRGSQRLGCRAKAAGGRGLASSGLRLGAVGAQPPGLRRYSGRWRSYALGILTVRTISPSRSEASSVPPCSCTRSRAMVRPRPVPADRPVPARSRR